MAAATTTTSRPLLLPRQQAVASFLQCGLPRRTGGGLFAGQASAPSMRCMAVVDAASAPVAKPKTRSSYDIITLTTWLLKQEMAGVIDGEMTIVLSSISTACKQIGSLVQRAPISNLTGVQGATNVQGEDQKKLDVISNEVFSSCLRSSGRTGVIASEEEDVPVAVRDPTPPAIPTTTAARLPLPRRSARARAAAPMTAKGGASPSPGGAGAAANGRFFTVGLVTAWYSSNIGVLLLNKYLLSNYGFKYPIFLTMCHMSACALLSYAAIAWLRIVPMQLVRSRVQLAKISALSLVFCGSVVSGNVSLRYLPVSFNQAVGATTPFFTAVFAYIMTVKRESWITYLTLVPVVTGVVIASGSEPSFHLFGFIMCIGATAARALKTVLQGILLSSEGEKLNSMNLLLYMAPVAVILLLPATLFMEDNVVGVTIELAKKDFTIVWLLLFNSCLAYFVNLTNFLVTKHTSALTLQVLGNAKGAVAVVVSILIFKNPVSITGMLGYTLTVIGVILYSESKKRSKP